MSLTNIALALFVLLQSLNLIGHSIVDNFVIGVIGIAFVILLVLATYWHWNPKLPTSWHRKQKPAGTV